MERRQMLKYLLAGGVSASVPARLQAQERQPRPTGLAQAPAGQAPGQQQVQQAGAAQVAGAPHPPVQNPAARKELERVLVEWEEKTAKVTKLRGWHHRYEYDSVFFIEKRSVGNFWFESPDKGRIDFNVKDQPSLTNPEPKVGADGKQYAVVAAEPEYWVCDGTNILSVHMSDKTYDQLEIPLHQRGENIMDGPLPFLFGMKADKLKQRYELWLGAMHDPQGQQPRYHVVAKPKNQNDARNWQQAEVQLDAKYCLPKAIRIIDPSGNKETVYVFPRGELKANDILPWLPSPFSPRLIGYKLLQSATKEFEPRQQRSGSVLPVNRAN